jgi:hypothetical protein
MRCCECRSPQHSWEGDLACALLATVLTVLATLDARAAMLTERPCRGRSLCSPKKRVMREWGCFSMCSAYAGSMSSSTFISLLRMVLTRKRSSSGV